MSTLLRLSQSSLGPPALHLDAHSGSAHRYRLGYTLQEMLVTLTIAGILIATAVGLNRMVRTTQIATEVNTLIADLNLARIEAIKRAQSVIVCKSAAGTICTNSSSWHEGWLVFTDQNENAELDPGEVVIRVRQAFPTETTLSFSAFGPGIGRYVTYNPTGTTKQNGTFRFCDPENAVDARAVILIQTGRARTTKTGVTCP